MEGKEIDISWNPALEKLLCDESEKCSGYSWLHNRAEMLYSNRTTYLQLPIIILSAVSGFVSGAVPSSVDGVSYAVGGVGILVSILGTINSYFGFARRAEAHRIASVHNGQISRAIRIEMNLPRQQRTPPKVLLKMIKEDLKRLSETAPRIPVEIIAEYKNSVMKHQPTATHPDICNGIEEVEPLGEVVAVGAITPTFSRGVRVEI